MKISYGRRSAENFERKSAIAMLFALSIIILLLGCAAIMCRTFGLWNNSVLAESSAAQTSGSAVKYEVDGQAAVYYDTLEEAVAVANEAYADESDPYSAMITVLKDITLTSKLTFSAEYHYITLDINGYVVDLNGFNISIGSANTSATDITDIRLTLKDSDPTKANDVKVNNENISLSGGVLHNGSATSGGAIDMFRGENKLAINGLNIVGCTATSSYGGGGAIYAVYGEVEAIGTLFSYNSSSNYNGGAILASSTAITLDNVILENNSASKDGGAIYVAASTTRDDQGNITYLGSAKLNATTIRNNSAANGGGICSVSYIDLELKNTQIYENTASETGGGMYFSSDLRRLVFENAIVRENSATYGGGLGFKTVKGEIPTGISINANTATTNGGGIYISSGTANSSSQNNSDIFFNGISVTNNKAEKNGGGIFLSSNSLATLSGDTEICGNSGAYGGGISVQGSSTKETEKSVLTMLGGTVSNNISGTESSSYSTGGGGAGVNLSTVNSHLKLYGGSIEKNVSKYADTVSSFIYRGSGIMNTKGKVYVHGNPIVRDNISRAYVKSDAGYTESRSCADNYCIRYGYTDTHWVGVIVDGALTDGAHICLGVYAEQTRYTSDYEGIEEVFTSGFAENNPSAAPSAYFYCDAVGMITTQNADGEAQTLKSQTEFISLDVTDNKNGDYTAGEKVDITVTVTLRTTDGSYSTDSLTPNDYTVAYSSGKDYLIGGSNTVTVKYIYIGESKTESITITAKKQQINLADENVYKWTLDGYGSELRSGSIYVYTVNEEKQYYSSAQTGLGTPEVLNLTRSIVRFRNKQLTVNLNNGSIPKLPSGDDRSSVAYADNFGTDIGVYTSTATLNLLDSDNFEYISQGLDDSRNMTIVISDNNTKAVITKVWYIVYIDNGLLSQDGSNYGEEYTISGWTYGDDITVCAPRLEHGDEGEYNGTLTFDDASDTRVSFTLKLDGVQIGETFYRYNFDTFVNKTMPAGRYVLEVSVESITLSDDAHTHWWDGETHTAVDGGLSYQPFTRQFDFTVEKAKMSVSGGLRNSKFEYVYDGDLHLYSIETTPTVSLAYAVAQERQGIWATDNYDDYYSSNVVIEFNLKRWNNAEYRNIVQLAQMSDNGSKPVNAGEYTVYYRLTAHNYEVYGGTDSDKFTVLINKVVYDMSGVTFENKTVTYDGSAHSIEIKGTLPNGVSVTYINNDKTEEGTYTVTARFTVADTVNYENISDMTATLKIENGSSIEPEKTATDPDGNFWWIWLIVGLAVVAAAVIVALIVVKKKRKL